MFFSLKNLLWFALGFIVLRPPTANPHVIVIFAILLSFVLTSIDVFKKFSYSSKHTQIVYVLMLIMTLYTYLVRYLNDYDMWDTQIIFDCLFQLNLVNLFMFAIRTSFWEKLKIIDIILFSYVVINLFTILVFPNGLYRLEDLDGDDFRFWFLGSKNMFIRTFLPAMFINIILSIHNKGHLTIKNLLFYILCFMSILIGGQSSTSIFVMVFLGICVCVAQYIRKVKGFNLFYVFLLSSILSTFIVLSSVHIFSSEYLASFLGDSEELHGRVFIWENVILRIINSPLMGFGYHIGNEWHDIIDFRFGLIYASHPHNMLLYILLQGGFLFLLFYFILFYLINKYTKQNRQSIYFFYLTLMYSCFYICGITESLNNAPLMFPMYGLFLVMNDMHLRYNFKKEKNLCF